MEQMTHTGWRSRHTWWLIVCCTALLVLTGCGSGQTSHSLPHGWTLYHDSQFPFQIPVPPSWQTSSFRTGPQDQPTCVYVATFYPPGSSAQSPDVVMTSATDVVYVMVNESCPDWTRDGGPYTKLGPNITIDGKQTTQYDTIGGVASQRAATADFGGHQYLFHVKALIANVQQDFALYTQMVEGFQYTGS